MKLHFLGTYSATEPIEGRHHVSWVLEHNGNLYWFDAGESCSRNGHLRGLQLQDTRAIFISHGHLDHVGGLCNLLWTIRKLHHQKPREKLGHIDVFVPVMQTWEGVLLILQRTEETFATSFSLKSHQVTPGIIFQKDEITVEALENTHLPPGQSMSYRIWADGKKIVYSGDVRSIDEMEIWFDDCDLLIMETGHHKIEPISRYVSGKNGIKQVTFIHHGREIINDAEGAINLARQFLQEKVSIVNEGDCIEL